MDEYEQTLNRTYLSTGIALPTTPASRQLMAYLTAFNDGDRDELTRFVTTHYETLRFDNVPAQAYAWWQVVAQRTTGGLRPVRIEEAKLYGLVRPQEGMLDDRRYGCYPGVSRDALCGGCR
jgi:hypothetical protein